MSLFTRIKFWAIQQASSGSILLGRRSGSLGDFEEITLGTNLSMSGSVLNATGGGSPTGSFTGSFTGSLLGTASFALNAPGSSTTGSFTGSFTGSLLGTASWAESSSQAISASWAPSTPASLQFFSESRNIATPNATVPAHQFITTGSETNIDFVLQPKLSGSILVQIPDNGLGGGNKRGLDSIDFQKYRTNANQVASAVRSAILFGQNNRNASPDSIIIGNTNTTTNTTGLNLLFGFTNTLGVNVNAGVAIGSSNTINTDSSFAFGVGNTVNGQYSLVLNRLNVSSLNASYSILGGFRAQTDLYGAVVHAPIRFTTTGDCQRTHVQVMRSVSSTGSAILTLNNGTPASTNRIILPETNRVWKFRVDLVAVVETTGGSYTANQVFGGVYEGVIKRVGTNTSIVGAVTTINTWSDMGGTPTITIDRDDTNEALEIQWESTGGNANTVVRVTAKVDLVEIGW